jgi:hypothetical protein
MILNEKSEIIQKEDVLIYFVLVSNQNFVRIPLYFFMIHRRL